MEDEYDIKTLDYLASVSGVTDQRNWQFEACTRANISQSNPAKWRRGREPMPSKFRKLRTAVIDMAIEAGGLPEDCHHKTINELIEIAKGWGL